MQRLVVIILVLGFASCASVDPPLPAVPKPSTAMSDPAIMSLVVVSVSGFEAQSGSVLATLSNERNYNAETSKFTANVKISGPVVKLEFFNVPEGDYALRMFRDINNNGKLDTNAFGIPIEPYAFSNNARGAFGPPSFGDAKFIVSGETVQTQIKLK